MTGIVAECDCGNHELILDPKLVSAVINGGEIRGKCPKCEEPVSISKSLIESAKPRVTLK